MNQYTDPTQHLFWLASRSLGIIALVLMAASVSFGLLLSGRALKKRGLPARLRNIHEALALSATVAIAGHGLTLLGDKFLNPGLAGITIPFVMQTKPLWTGIGVMGGWLAAIITFSFYVRRWIGTKAWRWLHRWTLGAYLLGVAHTLGAGTDARQPWMLVLLVTITAPVVFGLTLKLIPESRPQREPRGQRPQPQRPRPQRLPHEQPAADWIG